MQTAQPSLFARDDTFFGVCQAIGDDFGFNPDFLRVALPLLLFFYPVATIAGYFAAGAVVLLSRLLFPDPRARAQREDGAASAEPRQEAVERLADPAELTEFTPVTAEAA